MKTLGVFMLVLVIAGFALHTPPTKLYPPTVKKTPEIKRNNQFNWYADWSLDCSNLDKVIRRMEMWLFTRQRRDALWYIVEDEAEFMKRVRRSNCRDV